MAGPLRSPTLDIDVPSAGTGSRRSGHPGRVGRSISLRRMAHGITKNTVTSCGTLTSCSGACSGRTGRNETLRRACPAGGEHMTPKCSTKGCWRPATYEIEIRGPGADHSLYYCCNEHLPPPGALIPGVDRVRRRPTARNILNYRGVKDNGRRLLWRLPRWKTR